MQTRTRRAGTEALEASIQALAKKADRLATTLRQYEVECEGPRAGGEDVRGCAPADEDLAKTAAEIGAGIEAAEDEARRAWVLPGVVREVRQKHKLDPAQWDALAGAVRAVKQRPEH